MNHKPRLLIVAKNLKDYRAANYQNELIDALNRIFKIYFFGPGFLKYESTFTYRDIKHLHNIKGDFDLILFSHSWLNDRPGEEICSHRNYFEIPSKVPTLFILNKEYTNLKKKIEYINVLKPDLILSHWHKTHEIQSLTKVKTLYFPFATKSILHSNEHKKINLYFSGIHINPTVSHLQTDIRIRVFKEIFVTLGDLKVRVKKKYRNFNIDWSNHPTYLNSRIVRMINSRHNIDADSYYKKISKSVSFLATPSPLGLIGPKYFEPLINETLCVTPSLIFPRQLQELNEFTKMFEEPTEIYEILKTANKKTPKQISALKKARSYIWHNHTWDIRAKEILDLIQ